MPTSPPQQDPQQSVAEHGRRGASFVSAAVGVMLLLAVGKVFGFGEKLVLAHFAGATSSVDAYFTAGKIAFFFFVIVDDVLVPVFLSRYIHLREQYGSASAWRLFRQVFAATLVVLALVVLVLTAMPNLIVDWLAPGFNAQQRALTLQMLPWVLPAGLLLGLAALTYVMLNAHQRFAWPQFANVANKAVLVVGVALLLPTIGIVGAAVALCAGAACQLLLHLHGIRRCLHADSAGAPEVRRAPGQLGAMLRLMAPLAIGTLAAQASGFVDVNRGSTLAPGSIAALDYARKLVDLPILLVPNVLAIVAFPRLAELAARKQTEKMVSLTARLLEFCLILFLPMTVFLTLASEPVVAAIFSRGEFDQQAVTVTSRVLVFFALGLGAFAIEIPLLRMYYATLDMITPIVVGLVLVAVNVALTIALIPVLGIIAIPLALSTQKVLKVIVLFGIIARRYTGPWRRQLAARTWRILICVAAFAAVFATLRCAIRVADPETPLLQLVELLATGLVAGVIYGGALVMTGVVERGRLRRIGRLVLERVSRGQSGASGHGSG